MTADTETLLDAAALVAFRKAAWDIPTESGLDKLIPRVSTVADLLNVIEHLGKQAKKDKHTLSLIYAAVESDQTFTEEQPSAE